MNKAIIFGTLVLTTVNQADGAPIVDQCGGRTLDGQSWHGRAIHLTPWRFNRYGDRVGGKALCVGVVRRKVRE